MDNVQVLQRYEGYKASIEQMVLEVVKEQLNRRQGAADNITRNFIKFLTTACGLMEVRHLGISISVSGFLRKFVKFRLEFFIRFYLQTNSFKKF